MFVKTLVLAAVITAQPLVHDDVLEPSVLNEVDHALSRAPTNAPPTSLLPIVTNALPRSQLAIRLVSAQGADGRWRVGTNDVSAAVVKILREMIE